MRILVVVGALVALGLAGCDEARPRWARPHTDARVLVTVDGAPITAAELAAAMESAARAANPHEAGGAPDPAPDRAAVLETLIDQELEAQQAAARGLDADPDYQAELGRLQAQVTAFRRQRLALLLERDTGEHVAVSEAEARRYFDANADRIRTQVRVSQILSLDGERIAEARRKLDAGEPFASVAAWSLAGTLPPGATPWDLGYLSWNQLPEPWQPALASLSVGGVSGVIEGPRGRRWIIQLADRHIDPSITYEQARPAIMLLLQSRAGEAAVARLHAELRDGARIERAPR